jgi:hypothetical protein
MKQAEQGVQIHNGDVLRVGKDRKVAPHGVLALRTEVAASAARGKALTVPGGDGQVTALHDEGGPVLQHHP